MSVNPDYSDLFRVFNDAEVRYVVVGAYAVIYHTEPRYTKDLDLWVEPARGNAERVYRALAAFGAPLDGVTPDDFTNQQLVYQIGIEPNRIDILMGIGKLVFSECWLNAAQTTFGGVPVRVLGLDDLVAAKSGTGRIQDGLDVERLLEKKHRS